MSRRIPHKMETFSSEKTKNYIQSHQKNLQQHFKAFLKELEAHRPSGSLLEIGSGPGFLTALVAKQYPGVRITALELSPHMIPYAREYARKEAVSDRVNFVNGSAEDSRVFERLGKFDLVYSTFSLHHWEKPQQVLKNLYQALADSGTLFIHDFKRVGWLYYLPLRGGLAESLRASYKPKELLEMVRQIGVQEVELKFPFPYFWMSLIAQKNACRN